MGPGTEGDEMEVAVVDDDTKLRDSVGVLRVVWSSFPILKTRAVNTSLG